MKITQHLLRRKGSLFSFEILPPLKGKSIESLYRILDILMEFKPPFINVTFHRAEQKFRQLDNGYYEKVYVRKRPGTVGICAAIQYKYGIDAVPHLVCGGFSQMETEDALVDLNYLGVDNVLLLRGDPVKPDTRFVPEPDGHQNALELVKQAVALNQEHYLDPELSDGGSKTDFCIGVAGYPEKHFEAPNMQHDLEFLRQKVEAGANFIVTQMFFDNKYYFDFVAACRNAGIEVPIIPGIKPITSVNQVQNLPSTFHINIPNDLAQTMLACANNKEAAEQEGIKWTINQCQELIKAGVPCIHFYTMSNPKPLQLIMQGLA